jgi:hypothetical protein
MNQQGTTSFNHAVRMAGAEPMSPQQIQRQWDTTVPTSQANYAGLFTTSQADLYGIPAVILDALTAPNPIVDLFGPPRFNNMPLHPYELLTTAGPVDNDISFTEGGCPDTTEHGENRFALSAKSFGVCTPRTTYVALASKQNQFPGTRTIVTRDGNTSIVTEWEYQLYITLRAARQGLEWLILNGNPVNNALNFEGLDRAIRAPAAGRLDVNGTGVPLANSVVFENGGNRITVDRLYQMVGAMEANYVFPGDITLLMSSGMANEIARLIGLNYNDPGQKREDILRNRTFPLYGFEIPFRTSQWIGSTATGNDYEYQSTIFFISLTYRGLDVMWMEYYDFTELVLNSDLFANPYGQMGTQPGGWYMVPRDRGDYCTSTSYCLWGHGRLMYQAPQALGRINDVTYEFINERVLS